MTEAVFEQVRLAESALQEAERRLGSLDELRTALGDVVGRAEGADGLVVVECTPGGGVTRLDLDPRAMRMPSVDLADVIRTTIGAAMADLQAQVRDVVAASGLESRTRSPEELREQLERMREQFAAAGRGAAEGLARAQDVLRRRQGRRGAPASVAAVVSRASSSPSGGPTLH